MFSEFDRGFVRVSLEFRRGYVCMSHKPIRLFPNLSVVLLDISYNHQLRSKLLFLASNKKRAFKKEK